MENDYRAPNKDCPRLHAHDSCINPGPKQGNWGTLYLDTLTNHATLYRRRRRKKHAIQMRKMEQQAAALVAGAVVQPNKIEDKRYVTDRYTYGLG